MRKTTIDDFQIFLSADVWRSHIGLFSNNDEDESEGNFRAFINIPIRNPHCQPEEIKNELFDSLKTTIKLISDFLETQTFDSLRKKPFSMEGK
jgi:hypothetical protein